MKETMYTIERLLGQVALCDEEQKKAALAAIRSLRKEKTEKMNAVKLARNSRGTDEASMSDDEYFVALDEIDGIQGKIEKLKQLVADYDKAVVVSNESEDDGNNTEGEPADDDSDTGVMPVDDESDTGNNTEGEPRDNGNEPEDDGNNTEGEPAEDDSDTGVMPVNDDSDTGDDTDEQDDDDTDNQDGDDTDNQDGDDTDDQDDDDTDDQDDDDTDDQDDDDTDKQDDDDTDDQDDDDTDDQDDDDTDDQDDEKPAPKEKKSAKDILLGVALAIGTLCLAGIIALVVMLSANKGQQPTPEVPGPDDGIVDVPGGNTGDTNVPGTGDNVVVDPAFDMNAFTTAVVNIAGTLTTDEDIATNADIFVEKIGEDKLKELVAEHGELTVQKAIAEFLAFVPEIKMNQYIQKNGLDYNPNAMNDWYDKLDEAEAAYKAATGKNPEGAFMSLKDYDIYKNNREALKALIIESGDMDLLTWYEAKTTGYDVKVQQERDTEAADAYKEEVKLELVNNANGSIKLIELQLDQKVNGTNPDTLNYTEVYEEFIKNNYMYVVAN